MVKAIVLISGGLDSILTYKILEREGLDLIGIQFINPISSRDTESSKVVFEKNKINYIQRSDFHAFVDMLKNPRYGYGKFLNPCIDCRLLRIRLAAEMMKEFSADFIATGEVLNQRPKSQLLNALEIIEKESGIHGLILRPLSAKHLPVTIPEEKGWVKRENLYGIKGRSRDIQLKLAEEFGITEFHSASGGCPLAETEYAQKLKDLMNFNLMDEENIILLNIGRHFRISPRLKMIIGRNHEENLKLIESAGKVNGYLIIAEKLKGPVGLLVGSPDNEDVKLSAGLLGAYFNEEKIDFIFKKPDQSEEKISINSLTREDLNKYRIIR
ncbi:MAG: hypothetical protein PHV06_06175 [bacterium]|nr:hypothetical protein [bacterium]